MSTFVLQCNDIDHVILQLPLARCVVCGLNSRLFGIQVNRDSSKDLWQQASLAPGEVRYGIILSTTRTKTRVYAQLLLLKGRSV